ncbi:MAG: hypothetical protein KGV51_01920 [Moraxellaceae bacterium]|nr:hypothetical protein [Moraxellaceae bacterium]
MKKIKKHQFEAVSLLTSHGGLLDISIVPVLGQPSWLIPTALILEVNDFNKFIDKYHWQEQEINVYHLLTKELPPKKMIVLEGNTPDHRIALQTSADIINKQYKISDVKDTELPSDFIDIIPFIYQTVKIEEEIYIVPDIDMIAHHLLELED